MASDAAPLWLPLLLQIQGTLLRMEERMLEIQEDCFAAFVPIAD